MDIKRERNAGTIILEQEACANVVLDRFGMADSRPVRAPADAGPISIIEDETLPAEETKHFRSATGYLLYLSRCTRPEMAHFVMILTRSMAKPGPNAVNKLKRVLRYLKGNPTIGVTHNEDAEDGNILSAFIDSDFAGDSDTGHLTTGVVLYLVGGPMDWSSS